MKVAVLFYGQPRYLDNPFPEMAYKNELLNKYACDVFCHHWWGRDVKEYEVSTWVASSMHPDPNAVTKIIEKYAPTSLLVETPKQFQIPKDMEEYIHTNFQYNPLNTRNILSHLYSISEVSKLAFKHEDYFDFYVLARTDMVIRNVPDLWNADKNKLYLPNNHGNFPDTAVVFGNKFLGWACNLYEDAPSVLKTIQEPTAESFKLGTFLARHNTEDMVPCSIYGDVVRNNR